MKSLSKNMIVSILARLVTLVTGIVLQREILLAYGSTFNGLTSFIGQVMSYLVLLEAGLGAASMQALYQPLATGNWNKVSGILIATGREYRKISAIFLGSLVAIAAIFPFVVKDQVEYWISSLLMLVIGGSYIISYVMGGKYKTLLMADRKIYILYWLDIFANIMSCILRIAALRMGYNIVAVQFINLLFALVKNAVYALYVRKKYGQVNYHAKPDFKAVSKRWNVLIHSLAGIVVNHTDIMILTMFSSLKVVSVYSVYNMVFGQLSTLIQGTFMQAPQANFGNLYNSDKEKYEETYSVYEWVIHMLLFVVSTIALIMITPFIVVYTDGITDITYVDSALPILFSLILLLNQIRIPALLCINASGDFKETQNGAIIEAALNITVSLFLYFMTPLKMKGLLLGTVISYLYRTIDVYFYTYKHILKFTTLSGLLHKLFINLCTMGLLYFVFVFKYPIHVSNFLEWILFTIAISIVTLFTYGVANILFNWKETKKACVYIKTFILKR